VHLAGLRAIGCPYGQGYYFSKPLDAAHAEALLATLQHWQRDDHYLPKVVLPTLPHQKAFPSSAA
jgi:predicted signal transduction protein with EAL and GGDEF domain